MWGSHKKLNEILTRVLGDQPKKPARVREIRLYRNCAEIRCYIHFGPGEPPEQLAKKSNDTLLFSLYLWDIQLTLSPDQSISDEPSLQEVSEQVVKVAMGSLTYRFTSPNVVFGGFETETLADLVDRNDF